MPAVASWSSSSSSASAMTSGAPRSSPSAPYAGRPAPRRRRVSSLAADPALSSLGAIYVGWQAGERDPAPLCCPRLAKRSLVRKYGLDAVGYLAVAPQDVVTSASKAGTTTTSAAAKGSQLDRVPPRPDIPSLLNSATNSFLSYLPTTKTTTTIPLSALPPLPPLKSSSESTLVLPPLPPIPSLHHPHHHLPSTPPELLPRQATSSSPQLIPTPSETAAPPDFDPGEFLNASLALFQSGGGAGGVPSSSQPTSPTLVFPSLPPIAPPPSHQFTFVAEPFSAPSALGKLETVPEDDYDESLWSAGEDPLGSCAATDVTSEASWAW
ncbi:hypothetical protein RHOSPDRAFT_34986 [Rhodotorula sp. JG-1b]|nr:hypothetical protein RHOSPDRAFT_34986 [Rhodotorula sp. JG-1b]